VWIGGGPVHRDVEAVMRTRMIAVFVAIVVVISFATWLGLTWSRHADRAEPSTSASPSVSPSHAPTATPSTRASPPATASASTSAATIPSRIPSSSPGPPGFPVRLRGKDIELIPTARKLVALTFDAGSDDRGLASILNTLAVRDVPATFFITGRFANEHPAAVRSITAAGHRTGNHSMTHPYFTRESDASIRSQLSGAYAAIRAAGGGDPRPLFRFPYGDVDDHAVAVVNAAGYVCVRWTVDTLGWKGKQAGGAGDVVDRVVGKARPGEIVLMHVGSNPDDHTTFDADALPIVITRLRALGYSFVTLGALL
jgi:peptidoglycan/xylan/chitin deacetylase (PgdA/CDA1 family)